VVGSRGRITYSNSGASDSEIFRINADGSHARQLTHNGVSDYFRD
jgi:hypothetical protein